MTKSFLNRIRIFKLYDVVFQFLAYFIFICLYIFGGGRELEEKYRIKIQVKVAFKFLKWKTDEVF